MRKVKFGICLALILLIIPVGNSFATKDNNSIVFLSAENLLGTWDPSGHTNNAHERLQQNVCDFLVSVDADNNLVPRLALSWKSINAHTWEFKLRQGVKFHDGTEMTAKDVKASVEWHSRKGAASAGFWPEPIVGEVVDKYTVRLTVPNAEAGSIIYVFVGFPPIIPANDVAHPELMAKRLMGTGPWVFDEYKNETVYMHANKDYWQGAPKVDKFIWKYAGDSDARLNALLTGEVDIIDRVESEQIPIIEKDPGAEIYATKTIEHIYLHFRNNKAPWKDNPTLRRAVAYAIDRKGIVDHIMQGSGGFPDGFLSPKQFGWLGASEYNFSYDPAKAKKLLAEAGYPNGKGLPELRLLTPVGFYPKTKEYGEYIVQTLQAVGVPVKLVPLETAAWAESLYAHNAGDLIFCGWAPGTPEPDAVLRQMFYSTGRINAIEDPVIDAVLDKERGIMDLEERKNILHNDVNKVLLEQMPSVPILVSELVMAFSTKLTGWKVLHTGSFYVNKAYFK